MSSLDILTSSTTDKIFETYTISSIKSMQNDLEKEITKKKDEIRVLVGEKYRDFVEISDKIHAMNEIARETTQNIHAISSELTTLNNELNFQEISDANFIKVDSWSKNERTVAMLSKLLIDVENQLWLELEKEKFMTATMLLEFAVHIRTVLNLETSREKNKNSPMVSVVWDSVLRFPIVITQFVETKLQSLDLTSPAACECFCSLALLQNVGCAEIIKKFLSLRLETLNSVLCKDNFSQNVRARIRSGFLTIIKTLEIMYYCFRHSSIEEAGEYWRLLRTITDSNSQTVFSRIDQDRIARYGEVHLPYDVKNFKVKANDSTAPLNLPETCKVIGDWIQDIKEKIITHLPNYLNLINSLHSLNTLQQSIPAYSDDWNIIVRYFDQKHNLYLWQEFYEPLVVERAKVLLSQRWNVIFARVRHKIENLFQDISNINKHETESDLHCFLWGTAGTRPLNKSQNIGLSDLGDTNLQVKASGLSPNAGRVCALIESLVVEVTNELSSICPTKETESQKSTILKQHQQNCCISFLERLIQLSKELIGVEDVAQEKMLFLTRLLFGMSSFCPSLKQCMLLLDDEGEKLKFVSTKLFEESLIIWRTWSARVTCSILKDCQSFVCNASFANFKLKYLTKWNPVTVTEESDDVDNVDIQLHVPFQASFFLQNILNELAATIGRTLPPKIIIMEMTDNIVTEVLNCIQKATKESVYYVVCLQFLFDVKYITMLLVTIEHDELIKRSNDIVNELETKIDPVDLDLISSSLSSNIRQFVYSTQSIFGSLMNDKPRISMEQYADNSEDPNIIHVATNDIPSFTLFPISSMRMS